MAEPQTITSEATCYTVRNGWGWANIYVRHGQGKCADESPRYWVELVVNSDYGSFGFMWTHIGENWGSFLSDLDMHYAMNKLMGERFEVELTGEEALEHARGLILEERRQGSIDKAYARDLWDSADLADTDSGSPAFFRSWDNWSDGKAYEREYHVDRWKKVNPQAEAFWKDIWPHFVAEIRPKKES